MMDWKFWVGDIIVPIVIFALGFFAGKTYEIKSKSKIKGDNNTVIQNSDIKR